MERKVIDNIEILKNLKRPQGKIKMVLDTDAYNEIDDQYAIAYALKCPDKLDIRAIYAAPFSNKKAQTPKIGMEKSYQEIINILGRMKRNDMLDKVYRGAEAYIKTEDTPVISDAAKNLIFQTENLEPDEKLYVVAIGAITNVASAIYLKPEIMEKIVVVWLGGNAWFWNGNWEFNCSQDILAAKTIFDSGVPLIQLPCNGVTNLLATTEPELRHYLKEKNELCDYLYNITCEQAIFEEKNKVWSKVIWDIAAIAWIVGDEKWTRDAIIHSPIVTHEKTMSFNNSRHFINQIQWLDRDCIFEDLFTKITAK